jgi:predicted phosphodiesterase
MRIAIVSDIHGNRTAFAAVLDDIRGAAPDLVLHGGDLADAGSSPVEIVDWIRDLGWPGVMGNTDEMLVVPASLEEFAGQSAAPPALWDAIREVAAATRARLGPERLDWFAALPRIHLEEHLALVHASPASSWQAPSPDASDEELEAVYGSLARPLVVFGHTHRPAIRRLPRTPAILANSGSCGMPLDGDLRAGWLLVEDGVPAIRRVEYDLHRELKALSTCGLPAAEWTSRILATALPQLP